jgi:hypothetical protein
VSIWSSIDPPEPIRDIDGLADIDVATSTMHPEHGEGAVRIYAIHGNPHDDAEIELSVAHAVRLRDALARAVEKLNPSGDPTAVDWR